jgi:hypothetical protein
MKATKLSILAFLFILWILVSILFVISIVGLLLFIPKENHNDYPSSWVKIGLDLKDSIIKFE